LISALADGRDHQVKPCYDQQALMRQYPLIEEICDAMLALGWGAYQNDHEDANGQFEMNWNYAEALTTADRHVFFLSIGAELVSDLGRKVEKCTDRARRVFARAQFQNLPKQHEHGDDGRRLEVDRNGSIHAESSRK